MRRRSTQRRIGAGLMLGSLVGAVLAGGPALAQAGDDEGTEVEAPVEAHALITHPINDALPDTVFSGVPPQVVCVVFPETCPESTEPVREGIGDVVKEVDNNQETSPLQPANPEGLTVTYMGGSPRYSSAVAVEMPTLPADEEYDNFELTFPQGQPSFSFDSPAFRRVVMAVIASASSQSPEVFQEQMSKLLEEEPVSEPLLGIEACPMLVEIPEDAVPPKSASAEDISQENTDGELEPAVDCLYGANGRFDEEAGTWTFNLTSAAKAWEDGTLKYHGILLRPTGAPNLAFGDPDTSTNAQVVLDISEPPTATYESSEPPPPVEPLAPLPAADDQGSDSGMDSDSSTDTSPSSSTRTPSSASGSTSPQSSSVSAPPPSASGGTSSPPDVPSAEVAPPAETPSTDQGEPVALDTENAGSPSEGPWAWLLLPVFGGGALLMVRSLNEPVMAAATASGGGGGGGALTRLVENSSAA